LAPFQALSISGLLLSMTLPMVFALSLFSVTSALEDRMRRVPVAVPGTNLPTKAQP